MSRERSAQVKSSEASPLSAEDALIERFIEPDLRHPMDTRISEFGVPVWALIGYLRVVDGDLAEVATAYDVPEDAVLAALAYYKRNPALIDAQLAINAA